VCSLVHCVRVCNGYKLAHSALDYTPAPLGPQPQKPSAEHHMQQHTTRTPEDGLIDVRNM